MQLSPNHCLLLPDVSFVLCFYDDTQHEKNNKNNAPQCRLEMDGAGDVGARIVDEDASAAVAVAAAAAAQSASCVSAHDWTDGERMASLVLALFGREEPAALRLKKWRAGPLRVQRTARVVAALAVLDERSPPDLPLQVTCVL